MSAQFDPYYTWLAIPPEEQPPSLYRLLGVKPLEANLDVIENAADQRMLHLRTYASGKQAEFSQKLLNEVSAAKVLLLDSAKKSAYDAELRTKLNAAKQAEQQKAREEHPLAMAKPLPTAAPLAAQPATSAPALPSSLQFNSPSPATKARKSNNTLPLVAAGVLALLLLAGVGGAAMMLLGREKPVVAGDPTQPPSDAKDPGDDDGAAATPVTPPVVPPVIPPAETKQPTKPESPATVDQVPLDDDSSAATDPEDATEPVDEEPLAEEMDGEEAYVDDEPAAPAKLPVPEKAERDTKRKEILAIFPVAQARTFEEKGDIAAQLIRTAGETVDDPAAVFTLLNLAREQAAEAGQIKIAFEATDMLAETFEFDGDAVRLASLQQASRVQLPPAAKRDIVIAGIDVIDDLSTADKFDEADALSERMLAVARPLRDAELIKQLADQKRSVSDLASSFKKAKTAFDTLKTSPDDADANLAAGRYLAFVKQDWEAGLAHLAKGNDAALAAAAKAELAAPEKPADQEKLADAWWAAADAQKDTSVKDQCRAQAVSWYRDVVDELSGLAKVKVEKRIDEARNLASSAKPTVRTPSRKPKGPLPAEITVTDRSPQPISTTENIPKEFAGFTHFPWNQGASHSGMLEFTVERPGIVYISASFPETKYEGNRGCGWYETRATRAQLVQAGWQELGKCPWDEQRFLYVRQFEKGGPYRIQTNKYGAPDIYLPPDPMARSVTTASKEPDLGVFSRDPAELAPSASENTIYLDDLEETGVNIKTGTLGKHGASGHPEGMTFHLRGETPTHALSIHGTENEVSTVSYQLDGKHRFFDCTAAIWQHRDRPDRGSATPLVFRVVGDGKPLWTSGPLQQYGANEECHVNIRGVKLLTLELHCRGFTEGAWGVWVNPRVSSNNPATNKTSKPVRRLDLPTDLEGALSETVTYLWDMPEHGARLYSNRPIRMRDSVAFDGKRYTRSFGMQPNAKTHAQAEFTLDKKFARITGLVALQDSGYKPSNAVTFRIQGDGKDLWTSPAVGQRKVSHEFDIDMTDVQTLTLRVDNPGSGNYCEPIWIEPRLTPASDDFVYLDDLQEVEFKTGWGGKLGKHGRAYHLEKGDYVFEDEVPDHCLSLIGRGKDVPSYVTYDLGGKYSSFTARVGMWHRPITDPSQEGKYHYEKESASQVVFRIVGDEKILWESAPTRAHNIGEACEVDISKVNKLTLQVVLQGGYTEGSWGVWANPQVFRKSPSPTSSEDSRKTAPERPIRRIDLQPKQVVAVASGSNHHTVFVNGQKLLDCGRDKAASAPLIIKPGDVITVKLGDRFDIKSFWMMVLSDKGEPLFETSEAWVGYLPVDESRWWDTSSKDLQQEPAKFTGDRRQYVDLVQRSAATALPKFKETDRAKPIHSPLQGKDNYAATYLAYVVTVDDLKPNKPSN